MSIVSAIDNLCEHVQGFIFSWKMLAISCLLAADCIYRRGVVAGLREAVRVIMPASNLFYFPMIAAWVARIAKSHKGDPVKEQFWQCINTAILGGVGMFSGWSLYRLVNTWKKGREPLSARQTSLCAAFGISVSICVLYVDGGFNMETLEYALSVPEEALEALQSLPGMLVQKITGNVQTTA